MNTAVRLLLLSGFLLLASCQDAGSPVTETTSPQPPVAAQKPHTLADGRVDEYYWIRDDTRSDPEMLALLEAENAYTSAMMAHTETLQANLFSEITARLPDAESGVPSRDGNWYFHYEYRAGGEYPYYLRAPVANPAATEVILDVNALANGYDYFRVGNWVTNPSQEILAWAEDNVSRREYTVKFKRLSDGKLLGDEITKVSPAIAFGDDEHIFYVRKDPQTLLPYQVWRHRLGTPVSDDVLVYEEEDEAYYTYIYRSRSGRYVVISLGATDSRELRLIDTTDPTGEPVVFLPRDPVHDYRIRHAPGSFYILTNRDAPNFRVMKVDETATADESAWVDVVGHRDDVFIEDFEIFDEHLVVVERENGLSRIRVITLASGESRFVEFPEPAYKVSLASNPESDQGFVRYSYASLQRPDSVYDYHFDTGESKLMRQDEVVGDFDPERYTSERLMVPARDGALVPVSLVYRADLFKPGTNPGYLYAYGSYGYSSEASFSSLRLSLLDRGFVYAIAHVRGGQEMGRHWYEDGRLLKKKNTFNDFIDVTRHLQEKKYVAPDAAFAYGGSAGGLLMGAIVNEAPELYRGVIAAVPFVDVITTMQDDSIPLTTGEYTEWGNPADPEYYDYMLSYSPYDQVKAQDYPNILVTTGLHDSQVQYFEPVKWVSRLRRMKTDDNLLLIDIDMTTGHGGASGRYERYRLDAMEYAFMLDLLETEGD